MKYIICLFIGFVLLSCHGEVKRARIVKDNTVVRLEHGDVFNTGDSVWILPTEGDFYWSVSSSDSAIRAVIIE